MSWILNLRKVASGIRELQLAGKVNLDWLAEQRREVLKAEPLEVSLRAHAEGDTVVVEGPCSTRVEYMCSRCLDTFIKPLEFHFHEKFTRKATSENDEDDDIHVVQDDQVDLSAYIEENVQVEMPFIPLCKEDCLGLCPDCGQNQNEQPCECKRERIDPRLAGLKDFFKKED